MSQRPLEIPEGIITRFRTLSLERLGRVEATWNILVGGSHDQSAIGELSRELHTLKGDSRMVGFDEVHVLSQKLEELFALAGQLDYRVSEDLDLLVTMAIQFLGMLLRKRSTNAVSGIDLNGFVRQVDEVVRETQTVPALTRTTTVGRSRGHEPTTWTDRLSEATRQRFAVAATNAYLEYLSARSQASRPRLRLIWSTLRDDLSNIQSVPLANVLDRHVGVVQALARDMGKSVELALDVGATRVDSRVAEAIDIAVVHLIRNAVDHGIETPDTRRMCGKPECGQIRIVARERDGATRVEISDDGGGIDLESVRVRSQQFGLAAEGATESELLECLFQPGFTTRDRVGELSGRGVGLDAVKVAIVRLGGSVQIASTSQRGTVLQLELPASVRQIPVYQFLAPNGTVALAFSARWTPLVDESSRANAIDPITALQIATTSRHTVLDLAQPRRDLVLRLRWGFLETALRAATEPELVIADRVCPTPDDYPLEIVSIGDRETILMRPEHLATMPRAESIS